MPTGHFRDNRETSVPLGTLKTPFSLSRKGSLGLRVEVEQVHVILPQAGRFQAHIQGGGHSWARVEIGPVPDCHPERASLVQRKRKNLFSEVLTVGRVCGSSSTQQKDPLIARNTQALGKLDRGDQARPGQIHVVESVHQ